MSETTGRRRQTGGREPFVMVPRALIYDGPSPAAVVLWAVLDDLARHDPAAAVSQLALADAVEYSERHLRRLVAELVDGGWLETRRLGRGVLAYRPLRRARAVTGVRSGGLVTGHGCPVTPRDALSLHAREEEEASAALGGWGDGAAPRAPRRPRWCGDCHEPTRMVDRTDGSVARCPACHPLSVPAF